MKQAEFLELIKTRRSIRAYLPDPVPDAQLDAVLKAASMAPSAGNRQDWEFIIVKSQQMRENMANAVAEEWQARLDACDSEIVQQSLRDYCGNFHWFAHAPIVIAVFTRKPPAFLLDILGPDIARRAGGSLGSAMLAAENLMLAAHATGLATCCLTGPLAAENTLREMLDVKNNRELACLVTLGYADETPDTPPRKPLEEIVRTI